MKRLTLALALVAGVAGCGAPTRVYEPDYDQIEAVERAARRNGVIVKWVNPPQRVRPAAPAQ